MRLADSFPQGPFQVEAKVGVWRELKNVSMDAVTRIWKHLERIARDAAKRQDSPPAPPSSASAERGQLTTAELEVHYEISSSRRTVTLLKVQPAPGSEEAPEG